MNKKDYVLKVLSLMKDSRPIAEGLSFLVQGNAFDDKVLDILVDMLKKSIDTAKSEIEKKKLGKAKDILQKLKDSEKEQNKMDQKDLDALEEMIQAI